MRREFRLMQQHKEYDNLLCKFIIFIHFGLEQWANVFGFYATSRLFWKWRYLSQTDGSTVFFMISSDGIEEQPNYGQWRSSWRFYYSIRECKFCLKHSMQNLWPQGFSSNLFSSDKSSKQIRQEGWFVWEKI